VILREVSRFCDATYAPSSCVIKPFIVNS
jgi:hypothetical protein